MLSLRLFKNKQIMTDNMQKLENMRDLFFISTLILIVFVIVLSISLLVVTNKIKNISRNPPQTKILYGDAFGVMALKDHNKTEVKPFELQDYQKSYIEECKKKGASGCTITTTNGNTTWVSFYPPHEAE
jgi:hypothetical protein